MQTNSDGLRELVELRAKELPQEWRATNRAARRAEAKEQRAADRRLARLRARTSDITLRITP